MNTAARAEGPVTMIATGEIMLGVDDDPELYFELAEPALRPADLVIGHLENMHTLNPQPAWENRLRARDPELLRPLASAHFTAVTLAGNPAYTYGPPGIADTIAWLDKHGIGHAGAGMNIDEATEPVIIERGGTRFGLLSYDCVGVETNAASSTKPGVAYVDVITHYVPSRLPGGPAKVYTWAEPYSLEAMCEEIRELRAQCDIVMVAIHMGLVRTEVELADYEFQVAHAAVDAGADMILGYHAHVLKGIEFYKQKPIFYCLGNFVTAFAWDEHLSFREEKMTTRMRSRTREWAGGTRSQIDPEYPMYPFPPPSRNALLLKVQVTDGTVARLSYLPCLINGKSQPEPVGRDARGQQVFDYMEKVTRGAGLNARYAWDGDEVVITPAS
jgi:poly-gamma-glutamate capsule biosynthesis protein CapA/YwtB (metallophosphatase superfamily)